MKYISVQLTFASLSAALLLVACSPKEDQAGAGPGGADSVSESQKDRLDTRFVTIAAGGASGPYNIIATTLGDIYTKTYGVNSKTQTTGASVENINLMSLGKVEMAFVMSDVLSDALTGANNFSHKVDNIQQVASLYPNYVQVVAAARSGINTLEDLRGKRVAVGAQNSGVEVNARTILNGHGISYDDLRADYLGYAEAADALKGGKIDAAFLSSGLPNAALLELAQGFDLQLVSITADKVQQIANDKSYFIALDIPAGTYGNEEAVPTAAIMNALIIRSDISKDDGYRLTKTFFENLENLQNAHQAMKDVSLEQATNGLVAELHPGARKFHAE